MKIKCIIIEDEPVARKILVEYIEEIDYLELKGVAENPLKAMPLLDDNDVDLLFLDINMPKINGIDFLKSYKSDANIIITTAYPIYAVEAFVLDVLDYLVKPISFERFLKACNKMKELRELKNNFHVHKIVQAITFLLNVTTRLKRCFTMNSYMLRP